MTVAAKIPHAVIYLVSALSFHELTTQIPHEVWIAIPRNSKPPRLDHPPIRVSRLTDVAFKTGIEKHAVDGKTVSVYSREKTLADCFSRRNEVGLDVAIEALKFYMTQGKAKVDPDHGACDKAKSCQNDASLSGDAPRNNRLRRF